jgi:hypothetical protein
MRRVAVVLALAALVGCGLHLPPWPVPSPSATPGPEPTPSAPPTPPAPSPAPPSPMPSATPTPTPSPEATPHPQATPSACPPLVRWGTSLGVQTNPARDVWYLDSTPRFGTGHGQPCNEEHHVPCTGADGVSWRRCEDPRGGDWQVRGAAQLVDTCNDGYCAHVQGPGQVQVCPLWNVQDAEGKPVHVAGDGCSGWVEVP